MLLVLVFRADEENDEDDQDGFDCVLSRNASISGPKRKNVHFVSNL